MPPSLSDQQVAELARQQAQLDVSDEQVMQMAQQQATKDVLGEGKPAAQDNEQSAIRPMILPMGLGTAGSIAGGRLAGPVGATIGSSIGSGVGEGINQLTGMSEPSMQNLGTAFGVPAVAGAAGSLVSKAAPFLMPGRWAQALNAAGPQAAAAAVGKMAPHVNSGKLFDMASKAQVKVPMNRTLPVIDDMLDDLTNVSGGVQRANATVIEYLKDLRSTISSAVPGMDPMRLQKELEGAGHVIKKVGGEAGSGQGAIKRVFKAMANDLDDAAKMGQKMNPGGVGAQALVEARSAFKREKVLEDIGESIQNATRAPAGQGDLVRFDASKVINKLRTDDRLKEFYQQAFSVTERADLEKMLYRLNKIPALSPGAGQHYGSGRVAGGAFGGGGIGYAASHGDPLATGLSVAAGVALPGVLDIGKNVSLALQLGSGRALLGELLKQSKGSMTPQVASILGAYAESVRQGQVNE